MVEEINNILDGVEDSGVGASDLREEEISTGYEDRDWTAEVTVDNVAGQEYVQVTYNIDSVDTEDISSLAQDIEGQEVAWGINWSNFADLSEPEIAITQKEDEASLMDNPRPSDDEIQRNKQVAAQLGFEKTGWGYRGKYQCDIFSRDQEIGYQELIDTLSEQDETYFIKKSTVSSGARIERDDGEIDLDARIGEDNSVTVDVYIPMENGDGIDDYSDLDVRIPDEFRKQADQVMENLDAYTKAKIDRDSESDAGATRMPSSETLTRIEGHIGQGDQVRIQ